MKIGIVAPGIWGTVFYDTAAMLASLGHDVRVYSDDARAAGSLRFTRMEESGVHFYLIHNTKRNPLFWLPDKALKPFFGRRFFTTLFALYRYFSLTRDSDIYLVENDWMGMFVAIIARVRRFRWAVGVHDTDHLRTSLNFPGRPDVAWMRSVKLWVLKSCDSIRANSWITREALMEGGCPAAKIAVIPLHVSPTRRSREDLEEFRPRARATILQRYGLPADARLLMTMCRVTPVKGLDLAIQALQRVLSAWPASRLFVCGPDRDVPGMGSYREALERLAQPLGVADRVIFTGNIDVPNLREYLAAADVHLAPSIIDTFSYSVVEATLAGTRSLVSDKVGVAPWLCEAQAGRTLAGREAGVWADAIVEELAHPPDAAAIRAFVAKLEALLDCEKISRQLVDLFATIAKQA
jgi:glycosyltransferase involved in cell wall biosynthesis